MLDSRYKIDDSGSKGNFTLKLPICFHWNDSKHRMLIVIETVDGNDLKNKRLLSDRSRTVLKNIIKHGRQGAKKENKDVPNFSYAAVNFNNARTFHLEKNQKDYFNRKFADRVKKVIKKLKPTHILVFGDAAFKFLFPDVENSHFKRGWVFKKTIAGVEVRVTPTLDLEPLYSDRQNKNVIEDEDDSGDVRHDLYGKSNLLGFVIRNTVNLFLGRHLYSLKHIGPNPRYVDSISKFDKLMHRLNTEPIVAWDTEGRNLTQLSNKIYVMQFAFEETKGYVLPFYHPKTPFSPKQLKYISKELKHWFRQRPPEEFKYIITMNGGFDLRVTRAQFGIPVIFRPVWDVAAGESCLDENIKYLGDFSVDGVKSRAGNLRSIFTSYRNDFYFSAEFSKDERGTLSQFPPDDKRVLAYETMDVQALVGIHRMQLERADRLEIGEKSYKPYYSRFVRKQMSNAIHTISHMEARGVNVDKLYLAYLKSKESPLLTVLEEKKKELYSMKAAKKANRLLLEKEGTQAKGGLFGRTQWILDIGKPLHQQMLFFEVMQLEPISLTKKKKEPQTDKYFQKAYKEKFPEVAAYAIIQNITKLWGTYVKGWWNKMKESPDSATDNRMRASYGFFNVVTGRTNSFDPNFQQVPTRHELSKHIKRMFLAPKGTIGVKFDYSAHEVRVWSIISGDYALAKLFKIARKLRRKFRLNPTEKYKNLLKKKGDIHIQNVHFFFGQWVDKKHWLRDAIKNVIFGVIYGKGPAALSKDIKKTKEYAQGLIDKLFDRFVEGARWLRWAKNHAEEKGYIYSPLGRRRNLYGVFTGIQAIIAALGRRGMNSPIQGMASEIAITAIRLIQLEFYAYMEKWHEVKGMKVLPAEVMKFVHDALHSEVPYEHLLPFLHILQYTATFGVARYYENEFSFKFTVEPEIELEIGATEDRYEKWDWSEDNLRSIIKKALEDQKELNVLDNDIDDVMKTIYKPYKNKEMKAWLDSHYPILGVKNE